MTETEKLYSIFQKASGVTVDSRNIQKNFLFFALKGTTFNGNEFAEEALERGALTAVIDEPVYQKNEHYFLVKNVLHSLQELAAFHRKHLNLQILAITGTNGKTTTKELITSVLKEKLNIVSTIGNLNNHIGVPLTLLCMNEDVELGIVEMGANHLGEIARLCEIAQPDFGLITNIGRAHLEGFGSFPNVIRAKSELYHWLRKSNGIFFINNNNPVLRNIASQGGSVIPYTEVRGSKLETRLLDSNLFLNIGCEIDTTECTIQTQVFGAYNLENIQAAVAVGYYFGLSPETIKKGLETYHPGNHRSQVFSTQDNHLILDSYNANPVSMQLAIKEFMKLSGSPKMVILGDMLELGEFTRKEHITVLTLLNSFTDLSIVLVGKNFSEVVENIKIKRFLDVDEASNYFKKNPVHSFHILLKGSRGMKLEKLIPFL